ncbi:M23 family metallopeptidase [Nocardia asiatica]|uniref:M23 family metallopeptidase n=1 Tax=Nocardia asiatica TaxID=209252 RepID=UPI002455FBA1|nr:M23 family metallopeptidase [Nocardia asiatica]
MDEELDTSGGWRWLAVAIPLLLVGGFVIGFVSARDKQDPACLPDMPSAPQRGGRVVWPIAAGAYTLSSPFGPRNGVAHNGADFAAPIGTEIRSATDGKVVAAGPASGFGNWIVVDSTVDGQPISAVYGHMFDDGLLVSKDATVTAGQPIAKVGNAGESDGAHLHFEIVVGQRLAGGRPIDPIPWLTSHAGPDDPTNAAAPTLIAHTRTSPTSTGTATAGAEMPALPAAKGGETNLQVDTIRLVRALAARFPQIERFELWRAKDDFPDHPSGRAADAMVPGWNTPAGRALGDEIAEYVLGHAEQFHIVYIIWQQTYRPVGGGAEPMEDRGGDTANHRDHLHITVEGGGYPQPGQLYGAAPQPAQPRSGCDPAAVSTSIARVGSELMAGAVPAAFAPWIAKAATTCPEVTQPLLAAQLENESGFRIDAHNPTSGAEGPAQFLPDTWDSKSVDGDGDGHRDSHSIPDAVMSQAAYDCELAAIAKTGLAEGKLRGDLTELWLSMYNCGPGATLQAGSVCQNPETLAYVRNIPKRAAELAATGRAS